MVGWEREGTNCAFFVHDFGLIRTSLHGSFFYFFFQITQSWESCPLSPCWFARLVSSFSVLCPSRCPSGGALGSTGGRSPVRTPIWVQVSGTRDPTVHPPVHPCQTNLPGPVPLGFGAFFCALSRSVCQTPSVFVQKRDRDNQPPPPDFVTPQALRVL